ncbi:MAG: calcium/sodium antiporter [Christensenellaceae bacterium]
MEIALQVLLLVIGFVLLVKGADWFVDGAAGIAKKLGVPQLVIGLTIVAMGTSAPEAAISISASIKGSADIAVGNVIGSNIMNVLLILGLTAVITPLAVQKSTFRYEIPFVILLTALFGVLGLTDGALQKWDGAILTLLFVGYLVYLFFMAKRGEGVLEEEPEEQKSKPKPLWLLILLVLVGGCCIVFGSNLTIDAATELARAFGMSERFIGLTIVALGTSLPELVTCIVAGVKKQADIAIGNIVGSNVFNFLFVIGLSSLIIDVPYQADFLIDTIICFASVLLLLVSILCHKEKKLGRVAGIVMLLAYAGYFAYLVVA